ncbi:MAG TPA: DHHA1 domain-containing protein, partial [Armatimonadota bacterium]
LVETGAQIPRLYQSIYENRSFSATKLLGLALASTRSALEGNVTYAVLTRRDFVEAGALQNETDGIVNHLLSIRGTSVALLFREAPDGGIRVSLRSRGASDVNRVAKAFGGGGHQQASGCTVAGPLDSAVAQVLAEVGKQAECWQSCA